MATTTKGGLYVTVQGQVVDAKGQPVAGYSVKDGKITKAKPAAKSEETGEETT